MSVIGCKKVKVSELFYEISHATPLRQMEANKATKGRVQKKNAAKVWSFTKPPSDPLPWFGLRGKKLTPIFLLENASVIAETNFTFGPMFKTNLFPL